MTGGFYGRSKRFNVENCAIENISSQRTKYVIEICIAVLLVIVGFVFMNMEEDVYEYEKSAREMFGILKFLCFGIAGIMGITNIILLYTLSTQENVLCRIYICLYDECIEGVKCSRNMENALPFQIFYEDLVDVTLGWEADVRTNRICFQTTSQKVECFFIENAAAIVAIVNEKLAACQAVSEYEQAQGGISDESKPTVYTMKSGTEQKNDEDKTATKFCMYCGIKISREAVFCSSCGKKQ